MDTWDKPKEFGKRYIRRCSLLKNFTSCTVKKIIFLYIKDIKSLVEISNHCLFKTFWPRKIKWLTRQDNVSTHSRHLWQTCNLLWRGFCFSCFFKATSPALNKPTTQSNSYRSTTKPEWLYLQLCDHSEEFLRFISPLGYRFSAKAVDRLVVFGVCAAAS